MSKGRDEWGGHLRGGDGHQSLESTQDLIVGGIIRDLIRLTRSSVHDAGGDSFTPHRVHVSDHSGDPRQPSPSTGDDANVLVRVLADLSTPVVLVVEVRDGLTKG